MTGEWLAAARTVMEPSEGWLAGDVLCLYRRRTELEQAVGRHDPATLQWRSDVAAVFEPLAALGSDRVAGRSADGDVVVVRIADDDVLQRIPAPVTDSDAVAATPDGSLLAVVAAGRRLSIWDTRTARLVVEGDELPSTLLLRAAWSPDGTRIAVGTREGALRLYDAATAREILALRPHAAYVYDLAWSPDSETLASASGDGSVRLHGTRTTRELLALAAGEQRAEEAVAGRFAEMAATGALDDRSIDAAWAGASERAAARRLRLRRAFDAGERTLVQALGPPRLPEEVFSDRRRVDAEARRKEMPE